jgi:hypothetical protein
MSVDELFAPLPLDSNLRVLYKLYYLGLIASALIGEEEVYPGFQNDIAAHYTDFLTKMINKLQHDGKSKEEIKALLAIDDNTYENVDKILIESRTTAE